MSDSGWSASDIPDQHGRVVIVTGATSGIGKEAARVLASKAAKVVLAVRDEAKGRAVADAYRAEKPGADVSVRRLDLASLASIKSFAEDFLREQTRLDILINNAA